MLEPLLASLLRERSLPLGVDSFLERSGVTTVADFDALQGRLWEPLPEGYRRLKSLRSRSISPSVHVYLDPSGLLQPGVSQLTYNPMVSHRDNADAARPTPWTATLYDDGAMIPVLFDSLRRYAAAPAEAALFFSLIPVHSPPLYQLSAADRAEIRRWRLRDPSLVRRAEAATGGSQSKQEQQAWLRWAEWTNTKMCAGVGDAGYLGLRHLNERTQRRHMVLTLANSATGTSLGCLNGSASGQGELGLSLAWDDSFEAAAAAGDFGLQLPCLSSIRWSVELERLGVLPPWFSATLYPARRVVLLSFVGSANTPLKAWLLKWCRGLRDPSLCTAMEPGGRHTDSANTTSGRRLGSGRERQGMRDARPTGSTFMRRALALKSRSLFCLEPPGLNPMRKSMLDGLLSGCIPIFFFPAAREGAAAAGAADGSPSLFDSLLPLHFRWRHHASVALEPAAVTSGEVELVPLARRLNASGRAARMQRAIAEHAHQLVWSLGDEPVADDAVETLLKGLERHVLGEADLARCTRLTGRQRWRCEACARRGATCQTSDSEQAGVCPCPPPLPRVV